MATTNVPMGNLVIFYPQGDTTGGCPAVVYKSDGKGRLDIGKFPVFGGTMERVRKGIRHVDDKYLKENPMALSRDGCWESVIDCENKRLKAVKKKIEAQERLVKTVTEMPTGPVKVRKAIDKALAGSKKG